MRRIRNIIFFTFFTILAFLVLGIVAFYSYYGIQSYRNLAKAGPPAPLLTEKGFSFRDLNKNHKLDIYEDRRKPIAERIKDLISQMTLEEKCGMMFINIINVGENGQLFERPNPTNLLTFSAPINSELIIGKKMNHFNVIMLPHARETAMWYNRVQKLAERTRLGIPVTIASDPRHAFSSNPGTSAFAGDFSQWCEPIGFAAARDTALVRQFANIARQEYLAVGIRLALHPMADLATEPRWARINGTFGEDAELAARMVYAYIKGFQGDRLSDSSVACMTKHFAGGGPQKDGWDAHFAYGKEQVYPGNNFEYHLIPFEKGAFRAGTAQMMPYYGIPMGQTSEDVGFAFNKDIITGLLRHRYGFEGVVCSDWSLLTDKVVLGKPILSATGWGVEQLSVEERILKALDAGIDQFGGESIPEVLVKLVREGRVSKDRLDGSVRRLLRDKFRLGLFDYPYVDVDRAENIVGRSDFRRAGAASQRNAMVLLKNTVQGSGTVLPLQGKPHLYVENMDSAVASRYGTVVRNIKKADLAILRLHTPYDPPRSDLLLENFFHQGDLNFKGEAKAHILQVLESVPTIVVIYMDRPAVIPEIARECAALLVDFGASDEAVMDVLSGNFNPHGRLPFELPSSMDAVRKQKEDLPYDSEHPLFPFGYGLTYPESADSGGKGEGMGYTGKRGS